MRRGPTRKVWWQQTQNIVAAGSRARRLSQKKIFLLGKLVLRAITFHVELRRGEKLLPSHKFAFIWQQIVALCVAPAWTFVHYLWKTKGERHRFINLRQNNSSRMISQLVELIVYWRSSFSHPRGNRRWKLHEKLFPSGGRPTANQRQRS